MKSDWARFQDDIYRSVLFVAPHLLSTTSQCRQTQQQLSLHCSMPTARCGSSHHQDETVVGCWQVLSTQKRARARRRLERRWLSTRREADYRAYRKSCRVANKITVDSRRDFYSQRITTAGSDARKWWSAIKDLIHMTESNDIFPSDKCKNLCNVFAKYFNDKIRSIKLNILSRLIDEQPDPLASDLPNCCSLVS